MSFESILQEIGKGFDIVYNWLASLPWYIQLIIILIIIIAVLLRINR